MSVRLEVLVCAYYDKKVGGGSCQRERGGLEFLPGAGGAPFSSRCRGSAVQLQVMMVVLLERALRWGVEEPGDLARCRGRSSWRGPHVGGGATFSSIAGFS